MSVSCKTNTRPKRSSVKTWTLFPSPNATNWRVVTTEYEYIALAFKGGYRAANAPKSPRDFTESRGFFYAPAETEGGGAYAPVM